MPRLSVEEAKRILSLNNVQKNVLEHCLAVSVNAKSIATKISSKGTKVDVEFVEVAALLHDIGRSISHGIDHGIIGAKILADYPEYGVVCKTHLGGGIKKEEAVELGLPAEEYIPKTIEQKIICYADKITHGSETVSIGETIKKFESRLGKDHPTIKRIKDLHDELSQLMD